MKLEEKYILITGASGGIGQAIATELAVQGAKLLLVARNEDKLANTLASLPNAKNHQCLSVDLTSNEGLEALNLKLLEDKKNGKRLNVLINNAGNNQFNFLAQRSDDSIQREIHLNLVTPVLLTKHALTWMSRPGIVLNIGSTFSAIGYPGYATYCASKAGLQRFSEAMDRELNDSGFRVLYLAPRATDTELNNEIINEMNQKLGNRSDSPQLVAQHARQILEKEQCVKWIGWPEKLFVRLNQLLPKMVSSSIRKQQEMIHHYINKNSNTQ